MSDLPALKRRIDALVAEAIKIAAALAYHVARVAEPSMHAQLHRWEGSLRETARIIADTPIPAGLS